MKNFLKKNVNESRNDVMGSATCKDGCSAKCTYACSSACSYICMTNCTSGCYKNVMGA